MITEKSTLMNVLTAIKPGLAKKGIIEQFTHFIFTGHEVVTYNDEICISYPFETDFECSVPALKLYKTLSGIHGEASVKMEMDGDKLLVKTASTKASFSTTVEKDAEERVKALGLEQIPEWFELPKNFVKALFLCMFSASKDMTRGVATCVYVKGNVVYAADGLRISRHELENNEDMVVFIPARSVVEFINFDDLYWYFIADNWAHFQTKDKVVFSSRIMEGEYPNLEEYFVEEGTRLTLPEELKREVDSMSFMAEGMVDLDKKMRIRIEGGKISCRMEDSKDWIEKTLETKYEGEPIELDINPVFLSQVMEKTTRVRIGERKALFTRENFKHVLALPEMK